jgi:hypothetical protein
MTSSCVAEKVGSQRSDGSGFLYEVWVRMNSLLAGTTTKLIHSTFSAM